MTFKRLKELKKNKKGFTLIEIIVVVVILAVLMAVAVPAVLQYIGEADDAKYESTARGAYIAAEAELTKAYTDGDDATTYTTAMEKALDTVNDSQSSLPVTSIVATGATTTGDPRDVTGYVITFDDGVIATLVPNGSVTVTHPNNE